MEYGLIGNPLKHSFSKEIHSYISDYNYELKELDENAFDIFMQEKNFKAINVTIPYKQKVIPYLDYIDDNAKTINAVNTIVNKDGKLYGYNTDILGVIATFNYFNINISNKNILILGTGATSNTVYHAVKKENAHSVLKAYRENSKVKGDILYFELSKIYDDINVIINTTSNGMYPHADDTNLVDLSKFKNLEAVMDVVYNPLRTRLLLETEKLNVKAVSGLYMLVAQAVFASKLFLGSSNVAHDVRDNNMACEPIYKNCLKKKLNIVLTGMPSCGKSTLGRKISEKYKFEFIDTDKLIENKINCKIANFIKANGEEKFRDIESEVIKEVSTKNHQVISTGGGAILRDENVLNLKSNGKVFFINRSLSLLKPTSDRPLTSDLESLTKKYNERLPIYKATCDIEIDGDPEFEEKINSIISKLI